DQVYQTSLQQFAAVKAATLRRESAEKSLKAIRGQLWPTLSLNGGLFTSYSSTAQRSSLIDSVTVFQNISYNDQFRNNYGTYVGLGLSIPIFANRTKHNAVSKAKLNLLNEQDLEDNAKIQLRQNVEQAYYNMVSAYKRYQALSEQVKVYAESFRIYKLRFEAGVLTSVEYIFAKNNLDAANLNLISARYDYYIDSKILDYYQGKLSF
ncbi:MAG TPA: TolC family protein, partial [Mucilaginibacter sp.]|nr:TolC family protein [Mucilaginibacter sp.]